MNKLKKKRCKIKLKKKICIKIDKILKSLDNDKKKEHNTYNKMHQVKINKNKL